MSAADLEARRAALRPEQLAALHARLRRGTQGVQATIPRRPRPDEPAPASFAQRRLWFLTQLAPESPFYNVATALPLRVLFEARTVRGLADALEDAVLRELEAAT